MKLSEMAAREASHVCIYGEPLTGKSTLVAKLAEQGWNILWLSFDGQHKILYELSPAAQARIELVVIPDTKDYPVGIETALKVFSGAACDVCAMHGKVGCNACKTRNLPFTHVHLNSLDLSWIVVVDPISRVVDSAINHIINRRTKDKSQEIQLEYKLDWDDWASLAAHMTKILTNIQHSHYNCICTAHVIEAEQEDKLKKLYPRIGSANYSRNAAGYFDHVIFCAVSAGKHTFGSSTSYNARAITGSRSYIVLEDQDAKKEKTLVPFFNGEVAKNPKHYGESSVKTLEASHSKEAITIEGSATEVSEVGNGTEAARREGEAARSELPATSQDEAVSSTVRRDDAQPKELVTVAAVVAKSDTNTKAQELLARMRNGKSR